VPDALATFGKITQKTMAFTLAETLIVMGVIGIVSALTLPNLNSSTGDKEIVAKVKKIYQNLNDALGRAEAVYGPYDTWFINDTTDAQKTTRFAQRISEFMKVSKDCAMATGGGCANAGTVKYLNPKGGNPDMGQLDINSNYKIITADGTGMYFYYFNNSSIGSSIHVDIDGPTKGPFVEGKDIFHFSVDKVHGGIIPEGLNIGFSNMLDHSYTGTAGAAWIVRFDNADYLKFTNSSGLCKSGTTVTEANPRCK